MRFPIVIEKDLDSDYGVTVPDIPGCFSAGVTVDEAVDNAQEAILTHLEGMLMDDELIPIPSRLDVLREKNVIENAIWAICEVNTEKLSEEIKRVNITLPERVLSKVDSYAQKKGETRSGFLMEAALDYMARSH